MRVYEFGDRAKPVLMLLPGTCCNWKGNFGHVLDGLQKHFYTVCVAYDGFDETEDTEFDSMLSETARIEQYIQERFGGRICAVYGCSLGGSLVGLLAARRKIHMEYGIVGSSDFDQSGRLSARIKTKLLVSLLYPLIHTGRFKYRFLQKRMQKRMKETGEYGKAFMSMVGLGVRDMSHITKKSIENQFYSDLITPLPEHIDVPGTEIHILYALKMGEQYRKRYETHFAHPIIHEQNLRHEELLAVYPQKWIKLIEEICGV